MIRMVRSLMKIWLVTYMACGCVACRSNKKSHPLEGEVAVSVPCLRDMGIVRPIAGWSRGDSNMTRFKYRDGRIVGGYSTEYGTYSGDASIGVSGFQGKEVRSHRSCPRGLFQARSCRSGRPCGLYGIQRHGARDGKRWKSPSF